MSGLPGSVAGWWPSPNSVMNQSALRMPLHVVGARRAALGGVVLGAAVDVVERLGVVDRHLVELRHRQVGDEAPGLRQVEALVDAAVGPDQQVVGIVGAERQRVVVGVLVLLASCARKVLPPSSETCMPHVGEVDAVEGVRAGVQLLVVVRAGGAGHGVGQLLPGRAAIGWSDRRRRCGDRARSRRRARRGSAARSRGRSCPCCSSGRPLVELLPGLAAVGRAVDARSPGRRPCRRPPSRWRCQVAA